MAFVPVQPPLAVHEMASVEDQVTVEVLPEVMLAGFAANVTVGFRMGQPLATERKKGPAPWRERYCQGQRPDKPKSIATKQRDKGEAQNNPLRNKIYLLEFSIAPAIKPASANCG